MFAWQLAEYCIVGRAILIEVLPFAGGVSDEGLTWASVQNINVD
jgi:hypothetical protein